MAEQQVFMGNTSTKPVGRESVKQLSTKVQLNSVNQVSELAQELCESRGGRPGLPSLISLRFLWPYSNTETKNRAQELCESRGDRAGLPSLINLIVSVDVKHHDRRRISSQGQTGSAM